MIMLQEMVGGGTGLYTLREAATYARIPSRTLSSWFRGDKAMERVFLGEDDSKIIGFLDFVQTLAVRNLRLHYRIALQKIRDAVERASQDYQLSHPFARRHTTYYYDQQIWIRLEDESIVQLSGKEHGQKGMVPVIEQFIRDISFDPSTKLAAKYRAFHRGKNQIMMNPKMRFGEPILEGCGYTPKALFDAAKTEGSIEAAAKAYGVSNEQVEISIEYFDHLLQAA
jgi:uncharacterized protein (DUF433 family)